MELWQLIVALIQGLVEWLPISSEGQVILFLYNFGSIPQGDLLTLVVWLHLGTAAAVVVRYPRLMLDILSLRNRDLSRTIIIATLCTAVTALPIYWFLKTSLQVFHGELINILVGALLLVTAVILYLPTRTADSSQTEETERKVTDKEASVTGLIQGLAVLPGLSRSGVTISTLLMQKVDKEDALRFSFLISVPAVIGILAVEFLSGSAVLPTIPIVDLILMEIIVFVTGLASMEFLLRIAKRIEFWKLCVLIGVVAIVFGIPVLF